MRRRQDGKIGLLLQPAFGADSCQRYANGPVITYFTIGMYGGCGAEESHSSNNLKSPQTSTRVVRIQVLGVSSD